MLELQLADVIDETADARSLVFKVPDGAEIPADRLRHSPGQFLTLRVPSDRTGSVARCYSLSSSPFTDRMRTCSGTRTRTDPIAQGHYPRGQPTLAVGVKRTGMASGPTMKLRGWARRAVRERT